MTRDTELALLRAALDVTTHTAATPPAPETLLPVDLYLDPVRFERERRTWHEGRPALVAHTSEVATPGDFVTRTVGGRPVLLVRGDDDVVRAFLNVCRHRGATVERRARGRCRRFVCPYHAWTYARDGALASVRHPAHFPSVDPTTSGLTPLSCTEAGGLLWVASRPGASAALDPHLQHLLAELDALGPPEPQLSAWTSRTWKANWKLLVEGGVESYHFAVAHKKTVGPHFLDTGSTYRRFGDHFRSVLPRRSLPALADVPEADWHLLAHANVLYTLRPNASILVQDGHYAIITMNPVAVDETQVDIATVGRTPRPGSAGDRARAFLEANHAFTVRTLEEDFVLAEEIQRGLDSGANTHLRVGGAEAAIRDFHAALGAVLATDDPHP